MPSSGNMRGLLLAEEEKVRLFPRHTNTDAWSEHPVSVDHQEGIQAFREKRSPQFHSY
jgi:hypothetical protein